MEAKSVKTVGRYNDNDIVIDSETLEAKTVGRNHATITKLDNNIFLLEDLNSLNGSFINGVSVNKTQFQAKDKIEFGDYEFTELSKYFAINIQEHKIKTNPLDFTEEFLELKNIWTEYESKRKAIAKKYILKTGLIRVALVLLPALIYLFFKSSSIILQNYVVISSVFSSIAVFATSSFSKEEIVEKLEQEYLIRYACPNPKCDHQLHFKTENWDRLKIQGKCRHCKAIYINK
jgi:hypothetical protein